MAEKESMESIFRSWELHLFRRVDDLEYLIERILTDMALAGFKRDKGREYLERHIRDMRDQVRENMRKRGKVRAG